ncbi:MAG: 4-hydroxyphenylacetate 3-hydroxylase family protein [Candidatus Odinarchaeota archaeon]
MPLKTPEEYFESIKKPDLNLYLFGEKIKNYWTHPIIIPTINSVKITYELAQKEEYKDLMLTTSHLTGEIINRFSHIHQSIEDLTTKITMQRMIARKIATCFQRCAGWDAGNALYSLTYQVDKKYGTNYHDRFKKFWIKVQSEDLTVVGSLTDPKGDRSKRPDDQINPDSYLHIVDRNEEGVIVRGAKIHLTGLLGAHYCIVMPTMALRPHEKKYAICFVMPADQKGLTLIYGRQSSDTRKLEEGNLDVGNFKYGAHELFVIFDDIFIPYENIFLDGETEFAGTLVNRFAGYHRQSYGGCKPGVGDVIIGATALSAKYNGIIEKPVIKEKLVDMIYQNEILWSCGYACSAHGFQREAGNYEMDMLLSNVCKLMVTKIPYKIARIVDDVAGGIICTLPSAKDLKDERVGPLMKKYLTTCEDVNIEDRFKVLRFIENISMGLGSVSYKGESMHGAGSPQAQRIMIHRTGQLEEKMAYAKELLDIKG